MFKILNKIKKNIGLIHLSAYFFTFLIQGVYRPFLFPLSKR